MPFGHLSNFLHHCSYYFFLWACKNFLSLSSGSLTWFSVLSNLLFTVCFSILNLKSIYCPAGVFYDWKNILSILTVNHKHFALNYTLRYETFYVSMILLCLIFSLVILWQVHIQVRTQAISTVIPLIYLIPFIFFCNKMWLFSLSIFQFFVVIFLCTGCVWITKDLKVCSQLQFLCWIIVIFYIEWVSYPLSM